MPETNQVKQQLNALTRKYLEIKDNLHFIQEGEGLYKVASDHLTQSLGSAPTDAEVRAEMKRLSEIPENHIQNLDQIKTGQIIHFEKPKDAFTIPAKDLNAIISGARQILKQQDQ